ncbi:MAG TPA: choice-of-anchor tandem repeat GloVer-containing protein [Verrucomicrobiae bacterium]|nr:choice-of-anchor tandem repeat GloVer-containing protein [Verrucomicrobiae bacterium]
MKTLQLTIGFLLMMGLLTAIRPAGAQTNFTILKSFTGAPDGNIPYSTLVADTNGVLYGTTVNGGISNQGTIFAIQQNAFGYTNTFGYVTLRSFAGATNGVAPYAGLVLSTNGSLYGITYGGGISNYGTVFTINRDGSGLAYLHSFTGTTDCKNPEAGLIEGSDGALYGTTYFADGATRGTIFKINKDGSGYMILHTFTGTSSGGDGQNPICKLLEADDGLIYGTTSLGGSANAGTVFAINKDGTGYNILYSFKTTGGDGRQPGAGLLEGSDQVLYGTTYVSGGTGTNGTVFSLNKNGSNYQILHRFSTSNGDGQRPDGELIEGADGALYGGTDSGGTGSSGTIYKLNKDSSGYQILRNFSSGNGDGHIPRCALLQLSNGVFYGTTEFGAVGGAGCVFALSAAPLPPRILSLSALSSSNWLQCAATSAVQYDVQRSTNLSSWSLLTTVTSQTNGQLNYSDLTPPRPNAYYRLQQH